MTDDRRNNEIMVGGRAVCGPTVYLVGVCMRCGRAKGFVRDFRHVVLVWGKGEGVHYYMNNSRSRTRHERWSYVSIILQGYINASVWF